MFKETTALKTLLFPIKLRSRSDFAVEFVVSQTQLSQ